MRLQHEGHKNLGRYPPSSNGNCKGKTVLDTLLLWIPDVFVHLKLHPNIKLIFNDPVDEVSWLQSAEDGTH